MSEDDYLINSKVDEFISYPKFFSNLVGVFPKPKKDRTILFYLYSCFVSYVPSYLFLGSLTVDMYLNLGDIGKAADTFHYFLSQTTYCFKLTMFTIRRSKFMEILKSLEHEVFNSYQPEQEHFFKDWAKFTTFYSKYFFACCYATWALYAVFPVIDTESILPHRGWFPFEVRANLVNHSGAYVFQLFAFGIAIAVNGSMDTFASILMNIGCAQLEILKDSLEMAVNRAQKDESSEGDAILAKEEDDAVYNTLAQSVVHHKAIIKLLSDIETLFSPGMFAQFLCTALTICVNGFELIIIPATTIKFYSIMLYSISIIFEILVYCWSGHLVMEQSSKIGESCYNMEWYKCSTRVRKAIIIIMERTKKPSKIIAAKFFVLSINSFTTLMRTSYSYFAVLRRIYVK